MARRGLLSVAAAAASLACAAPNLYTTPRAVPRGRYVGVIAPQVLHHPGFGKVHHYDVLFAGRAGLARRFDIGARTSLGALGFDAKWNAVRTSTFDLALSGGLQLLPETFYVDLPLLMGVNVSEAISLLPNTGMTLGYGREPFLSPAASYVSGGDAPPAARSFVRAGLGAQLRLSESFAVQPEVSWLIRTQRATASHDLVAAGIGFCFGPQPY